MQRVNRVQLIVVWVAKGLFICEFSRIFPLHPNPPADRHGYSNSIPYFKSGMFDPSLGGSLGLL